MCDAKAEEEAPRCVGCGRRVRRLFVRYSPGNIRLMKCDYCKVVADPYIECEFMIILIDLILHKARAYRHLLFNTLSIDSCVNKIRAYESQPPGKIYFAPLRGAWFDTLGILYQSILVDILLDAFSISLSKGSKADGDSPWSMFSTTLNCSKVLVEALLGNFIFMFILLLGVRFILKLSYTRYKEVLLAIIISSYFKLFLITMMVWEFPSSVIFIVEIFVLSSNVVALRVVTQFSKAHCFGVCFVPHTAKFLTERWLF